MKINTNIQALNAYRNLSSNQFHTSKNLEKLSSGLRINRAADDAAGLAISEKMRAQIRGLKMAERNSMDGISMIQTAEGALTEVHAMLQRMRELAVQASNDTNTETDRKEIQKEINQLTSEINRIGNATEFNTKKLLNGGATKIAPTVKQAGVGIAQGTIEALTKVESNVAEAQGRLSISEDQESIKQTQGVYSFRVDTAFKDGDTLNIGTAFDIEFLSTGETPTGATYQIDVHINISPEDQVKKIVETVNNNSTEFVASIDNNDPTKIILTHKAGQEDAIPVIGTVPTNISSVATIVEPVEAGDVQKGEYTITIQEPLTAGETITIGNKLFTVGEGTNFDINLLEPYMKDADNQALKLKELIDKDTDLSNRFDAAGVSGNAITLIESEATGLPMINATIKGVETLGEYDLTLTKMFTAGEKYQVGDHVFTAVSHYPDLSKGEFHIGSSLSEQADNLKQAMEVNSEISKNYDISIVDNKISLKEKIGMVSGMELETSRLGNATGTLHFNHIAESTKLVPAEWNTGDFTVVNAADSGTFSFNQTTINVKYVLDSDTDAETDAPFYKTENASKDNIDLIINASDLDTAAKQANAVREALKEMASFDNSPINGFTFAMSDAGIKVTTGDYEDPASLNSIKFSNAGAVQITNSPEDQLITRGVTPSKSQYAFDISNPFRENEVITINGIEFKGVNGLADPGKGEFSVDGNTINQANSLRAAFEANATLNGRYNITLSGSTITLTERIAGSETQHLTAPKTELTEAIKGQYSFNIERSIVGQSYTIDGYEIKVVNDSVAFNAEVNNGTAMRYSTNLIDQAKNLRDAINRNPDLSNKYLVSGNGEEITLTQRTGKESSEVPRVMLGNTGTGDTFKSQLQIGPNQAQTLTFELNDMRAPELGLSTTDPRTVIKDNNGDIIQGAAWNVIKDVSNGVSEALVEFSLDITSHEKATAAISVFDAAIERVNAQRASLGAFQNRLEHTINNLQVTHENLTASESRIRDADMALEMTEFTRNNILNQSATAMLAQANQLPQGVLQLLQ